ncbi:MAG: protein kinase domain-containing protein [Rudaea sp.]
MDKPLLLGRYQIEEEIGRGGMGTICRAHDTLLDRDVAVKLLNEKGLGTAGRARLLNEARAVAQLNHPNIVAVYDAGEADGSTFVVMELVHGDSLQEKPPKEIAEIVTIAQQVCAALAHAHAHGIVHRDLKLENVLITPDGVAKLADFGLARSVASRLTTEGGIVGTVFYLAPELALGQPFDGRADLYALGVMLYELTTGRLPFTAEDPLAIISQHLYAPVVPPRAHNASIPPGLEAVILQLMAKKPEDRPASAAEVRERLEHLDSAPLPAEAPSLLDRIARGRFVGREREMAEAELRWQRARAGEGQVLLVSGEPGIGKTRFVRELLIKARVSGGRALTGECYAEGSAPYAAIAQMLREAFDDSSLGDLALAPSTLVDLIAIAPDLSARFPGLPPNPALDPQSEQLRVFESAVAWCAALAARAPLLLFIDDAHWADGATLALLRHIARRTRKLPVLIVATYREVELDEARPWNQVQLDLNRQRLAIRLKLGRLSQAETGELLKAMLQEEVTPDFLKAIYRETEGNPFFAEEVCKTLVEEGKLAFENGCWCQPGLEDLEIPQSVRLAIQARVGILPAEAQETLRLAAVLGREFDFDTLARSSELGEEELITALEAAQRAQLVEEIRGRNSHVTFAFSHALIRLTLLETVGGLRRKRMHRRAAAATAAVHPTDFEAIARHFREAGETEQARVYYARAGDRALSIYAYGEAEHAFRLALELGGAEAERMHLLTGLGDSLSPRGRLEEAIQVWCEAIEKAQAVEDYAQVAELYTRASRASWMGGDMPRGLALAQEGLAAVGDQQESIALARLLHETARALYFNSLPALARPMCERALDTARRLHDVQAQADALVTLGLIYRSEHRGPDEEEAYREAIALAQEANLPVPLLRAYNNMGSHLFEYGKFAEARDYTRMAIETARRAGVAAMEQIPLSMMNYCCFALGDYPEVVKIIERMRELAGASGTSRTSAKTLREMEAYSSNYRGDAEAAMATWMELYEDARRLQDSQSQASLAYSIGDSLRDRGYLEEARPFLEDALHLLEPLGGGAPQLALLAAVEAGLGHPDEARQNLDKARSLAGPAPTFGEEQTLLYAVARMAAASGEWQAAVDNYESIERAQAAAGTRWYQAHTLREWAEVYVRRGKPGDRERAEERLRCALELYEAAQCPGYAARVRRRIESL